MLHSRTDSMNSTASRTRTPPLPTSLMTVVSDPPGFVRSTVTSPLDAVAPPVLSSVHSAPAMAGRYHLGTGSQCLIAICVLNGLLGLLFAHMITAQHVSFRIAVIDHGWIEEEKAAACRRAGIGYFIVAVLTLLNPIISRYIGPPSMWCCKAKSGVRSSCRRFVPKEKLSLLGYTRKGSDDSGDEDEMESRRPV